MTRLPDGIDLKMLGRQQRQRFITRDISDLAREDPIVQRFANLYVCGELEYGQMLEQLVVAQSRRVKKLIDDIITIHQNGLPPIIIKSPT